MISETAYVTASGQSALDLATRYEALRAHAVQRQAPAATRDGLVVLLRQGVASWMDAWSRLPTPPARPTQSERRQPSPLPAGTSAEVVRVLAAMTLGNLQEVHV